MKALSWETSSGWVLVERDAEQHSPQERKLGLLQAPSGSWNFDTRLALSVTVC